MRAIYAHTLCNLSGWRRGETRWQDYWIFPNNWGTKLFPSPMVLPNSRYSEYWLCHIYLIMSGYVIVTSNDFQVVQDEGGFHDKRRVFYSSIMNDNLIDCIIGKANVTQITPRVCQILVRLLLNRFLHLSVCICI